jgi:hypothetical protein
VAGSKHKTKQNTCDRLGAPCDAPFSPAQHPLSYPTPPPACGRVQYTLPSDAAVLSLASAIDGALRSNATQEALSLLFRAPVRVQVKEVVIPQVLPPVVPPKPFPVGLVAGVIVGVVLVAVLGALTPR